MEEKDSSYCCFCRSCSTLVRDRALAHFLQLPDIPFRILAAAADDEYRKPMLGMLHALKDIYASENVEMGKFYYLTSWLLMLTMTSKIWRNRTL